MHKRPTLIASPQPTTAEASGAQGPRRAVCFEISRGSSGRDPPAISCRPAKRHWRIPSYSVCVKDAQRANREFFKAMRTKMLELDPGLAELVRKVSMQFRARRAWSEAGLSALSAEERHKLLSLMAQVEDVSGGCGCREEEMGCLLPSLSAKRSLKLIDKLSVKRWRRLIRALPRFLTS